MPRSNRLACRQSSFWHLNARSALAASTQVSRPLPRVIHDGLELEASADLYVARCACRGLSEVRAGVDGIGDSASAARGCVAIQIVVVKSIFSLQVSREVQALANIEVALDLAVDFFQTTPGKFIARYMRCRFW